MHRHGVRLFGCDNANNLGCIVAYDAAFNADSPGNLRMARGAHSHRLGRHDHNGQSRLAVQVTGTNGAYLSDETLLSTLSLDGRGPGRG